jgi:nucleoside-diphosphate-sugar epimerase
VKEAATVKRLAGAVKACSRATPYIPDRPRRERARERTMNSIISSDLHVVFGAGPLGLAVARALAKRGARIRLVNRSGKAPGAPSGVESWAADASDPAQARAACAEAGVVYQCAAPAYTEWARLFLPLQRSILHAAAATGARLVVGENLYMYGETPGSLVESLPLSATTKKGQLRAAMANELLAAHGAGHVRVAIGRGSDFFGPFVGPSAAGERMFLAAIEGKTVDVLGCARALHSFTFIDDFGEALVTLGARDEALGQAWHVPNAIAVSNGQFAELVIEAAGSGSSVREVPRWMVKAIGLFAPPMRELVEMLHEFEAPFVVDDSAFTRTFGASATPLNVAIGATLEWYRSRQRASVPPPLARLG